MAPHAPRPDSERLQATVLYADISGFTALSEQLDPEDVTALMNRVFDVLEGIVIERGGAVNKYIGDCLIAVFGLMPGDSNATQKAVQAAIDMRSAIYRLNEEDGTSTKLDIHIGVNTGPVVMGEIGGEVRREFSVMGETVDLAARLERASARGRIYVGAMTFRDTESAFDYEPLEPIASRENGTPTAIYELVAVKPPARHAKRDSERRQATVLFAKITGFEASSNRLAPEELTALLNRCFGLLESIVRGHGGVVDKYIGECLMALFGVPNAIENAPQQAVNAAIEIRNRLQQLDEAATLPSPLDVHIGINTGLVIAGEIGGRVKRDFTVMGDTVNLAWRLTGAAPDGTIYVAPETYRHTKDTFEYRAPTDLVLKGKAQPVPTYELASVKQQVHRNRVATSGRVIFSELVGREREREQLEACITRVIEGEGGIVRVVGEAGLGKTRLMAEVLAAERLQEATVLEGRSTSIGQNLSFHPFIDLLDHWAGVADDDGEGESFGKLEAAVTGLMPDESAEVLPFVATLMGMRLGEAYADRLQGIEGESLQSLIVKSIRRLFERMAELRPLVLVFEDLHWADISSVTLLETLLRLVADLPILFIDVFRPSHPDTSDRIMHAALDAHPSQHTLVSIEPLSADQSSLLVQNLLRIENLPRETRELITCKAEGNPFYLEEVVRSLVDQGAVEHVDGTFRLTAKIASVVVPGTIQEVIMARVDRLDEPTRHLLQVASVIGRSFYYRVIADIAHRQGEGSDELDAELSRLQEKRFLLRGSGGLTLVQELEYIFTHALAQETVYESILQKTRREFHQTVADSIESLFADRLSEFCAMLAYHYTRADNLQKAEEHLLRAGDEALRSAASSEALNFFREAARIYAELHGDGGDPQHIALLEKNVGYALLNTGQLTESIAHFDDALAYLGHRVPKGKLQTQARFVGDMVAVLGRLYLRPNACSTTPVSDRERERFEIMFRRFRAMTTSDPKRMFVDNIGLIRLMDQRDPKTIGTACITYVVGGAAFAYSGTSFGISRRFLAKAHQLMRAGDVGDELGCGFFRFVVNFLEGRWKEEAGLEADLLDRGLKSGIVWDVNSYLGLECDRRLRQGRFAAAREQLEQLIHVADQYGYGFAQTNHDAMKPILLLEERDLGAALQAAEHYYAGRTEDALRVLALGTKAKIEALLGRHADARVTLDQGAHIVEGASLIPPWHLAAYTVARLRYDVDAIEAGTADGRSMRQRRRAAARQARRALRIAKVVAGVRPETWRLVGRLYWVLGRPRKAVAWWTEALREAERLDAQPEVARTCAEMALRAGTGHAAVADTTVYLERARRSFDEAGLSWDAALIDAARRADGDPAVLRRF